MKARRAASRPDSLDASTGNVAGRAHGSALPDRPCASLASPVAHLASGPERSGGSDESGRDAAVGTPGVPFGSGRESGRRGAAPAARGGRLDLEGNKSPRGHDLAELLLIPKYSGGRFDPVGGRRKRIEDIQKVKMLESHMRRPAFLTLTIDRRNFTGPEAAYDHASRLVSKLLSERLGLPTWMRVAEVQTRSGDGWLHWHIVIDLAEWRGNVITLRKRIWQVWRDEWRIGGCDVKPCRKSVAGYVAAYVTKAWPAIPPWMGMSRKRFRLVGFSKRAGELIRGGRSMSLRPPAKAERHRRYRPTRTLYERLASSGLEAVIIMRESDGTARMVGTLAVSEDHAVHAAMMLGLARFETHEYARPDGTTMERVYPVLPRVRSFEQAKRVHGKLQEAVSRPLTEDGGTLESATQREYAERLRQLGYSWAMMEWEREEAEREKAMEEFFAQ